MNITKRLSIFNIESIEKKIFIALSRGKVLLKIMKYISHQEKITILRRKVKTDLFERIKNDTKQYF